MVKAKDFTNYTKDNINFDIVEDIHEYMLHDSEFFRKNFFPMAKKISDANFNMEEAAMKEMVMPVIEQGINNYFKKFKIPAKSYRLVDQSDRNRLMSKVLQGLKQHPVKNAQ
jgi:hypothetical protein